MLAYSVHRIALCAGAIVICLVIRPGGVAARVADGAAQVTHCMSKKFAQVSPRCQAAMTREDRIRKARKPPTTRCAIQACSMERHASDAKALANALAQLVGSWNNLSTGENLVVGSGKVWSSNVREGRILLESRKGSNITLSSKAGSCSYYLTRINESQINLQLREGSDSCFKGVFFRVAT